MLNTYFSPHGSIGSDTMIKSGVILIALSLVIKCISVLEVSAVFTSLASWFTYLVCYPWICLWMKRYRDGEQDPFNCLKPILVFITLTPIVFLLTGGGSLLGVLAEVIQNGEGVEVAEEMILETVGNPKIFAARMLIFNAALSLAVLYVFNSRINGFIEYIRKPRAVND